ncbi:MAG: PEGA domain-containing protein [Myxococcales bacterium]|nr:PEGA domain-containing protein [Myxococcales bacterium]
MRGRRSSPGARKCAGAFAALAVCGSACATACSPAGSRGRPAAAASLSGDDGESMILRAKSDVGAARELDHEGVRSFREGHYADAVRYFRAAFRLGGPPSELWNIARSEEKLEDLEEALRALDEYLAQRDLTPQDRADADREAKALRGRPSVLTLTTNPAGASVSVDGKVILGATPLSIDVPGGRHALVVRREGYAPEGVPVEARFGRAIIVSLDLARTAK